MSDSAPRARIQAALAGASDTREVHLGRGALAEAAGAFTRCFGDRTCVVVADVNTFAAAGKGVLDQLARGGVALLDPLVFEDPALDAEYPHVERIEARLAGTAAIPVAVGAGTINDLTKLAAHRCGRPYLTVPTAASMDGYTAFGASITRQGSKQTFSCPAPQVVIADLEMLCAAPGELNAAGYADLLAKVTAGADWLLADALGVEPIEPQAWATVQEQLRAWIGEPEGIRRGDERAICGLMEGLVMTGLGMQRARSSRPASGAEHQFSHLWDMQHHRHLGRVPLHGCKVGIGTVASTLLYEQLLGEPLDRLDVDAACRRWPELRELLRSVAELHQLPDLRRVAEEELRAKYVDRAGLRVLLVRLREVWPGLRQRLKGQLLPAGRVREMLEAAGAPSRPEQIGIDLPRLRRSYLQAQQIRRRCTVLDLAVWTGRMEQYLDRLFAPGGKGLPLA